MLFVLERSFKLMFNSQQSLPDSPPSSYQQSCKLHPLLVELLHLDLQLIDVT